jgi:hypothetical protein
MRALLFIAIAAVGCTKQNPDFCPAHPDDPRCEGVKLDGGGSDGSDGSIIDARFDYGTGNYAIKLTAGASGALPFAGGMISTSGGNPCLAGQFWVDNMQPEACFVVAGDITISNTLTVTGSRPLVLLAANKITINGTLDVAGHLVASVPTAGPGAPAPSVDCPAGTPPGASNGGGGGGAGGTFMTKGGSGGGGDGMNNEGTAATALTVKPARLRAGCDGQPGAAGGTGATGGAGGGAVYIIAGSEIDIGTGVVNASGSGGGLAGGKGGGGGGGTGGMIVLFAPAINTAATTRLVANGGGGSAGGTGAAVGTDPDPSMPSMPAPGGNGNCGDGGSGYANAAANAGTSGGSNCAGGGGGGGGGYIQSNITLPNGQFSPLPQLQ